MVAKRTPSGGVPTAKVATRTPSGGVPTAKVGNKTPSTGTKAELDSGPVIEILHEPASGVVTSAPDLRPHKDESAPFEKPRADPTPMPQPRGPFATGSFILESDDPDFEVQADERPRRRAPILLLFLLLLVGGGALYYKMIYAKPKREKAAAAVTHPAPPPPAIDATPAITSDVAVDRAREVLRAGLRGTPRVQRVAASALSRAGDLEAIAWLASALGKETERAPRLELAYALGRAGDKRGNDALAAMLQSDPGARLDIGKRLAQLHDERAIQPLLASIDTPQLRLSVAEYLVPFAEPHALKALDEIRADDKSPDRQKRAVIALGLAGKAEVTQQLRALLGEDEFKAPAARALAELHDPAAKPVLVDELAIPTLRVAGARALRRLEPNLDATPLLPPLLTALDGEKDLEQLRVAETILLLAGDAKLAERE
jgi:HEAT repeat protein